MLAKDWARFLKNLDRGGSCIVWIGSKTKAGYGHISIGNKVQYAHRLVYEHFHAKIPDGMYVRHLCDNPACVNPFHLEIGTPSQNRYDMAPEKRRALAVAREAKKSPEERKAHAAKMRAAITPEGKKRATEKLLAAITKRNTDRPARNF